MVTRARGRFINRPTKTGRGVYDKFFVYIPTELARDSAFPLKAGQEVDIQIESTQGILAIRPVEIKTRGREFAKRAK